MWCEFPGTPNPVPMFYIQNKGYCGNCLKWWKEGGHGYTCDLNEAWKVTEEEAEIYCRHRAEDIAWPVAKALRQSHLHVTEERL